MNSETPWLLVSLQTDLRERSKARTADPHDSMDVDMHHIEIGSPFDFRNASTQRFAQVAGDQLPMATWQQGSSSALDSDVFLQGGPGRSRSLRPKRASSEFCGAWGRRRLHEPSLQDTAAGDIWSAPLSSPTPSNWLWTKH